MNFEELLDKLIELPPFPGEPDFYERASRYSTTYCRYGDYEKAARKKWYLYIMAPNLVVRPYGDPDQMRKIRGALKYTRSPWPVRQPFQLHKVDITWGQVTAWLRFSLERIHAAGLVFLLWSLDIVDVELEFV